MMTDAIDKPTPALPAAREPQPELGPAMQVLPLRWQKAVTALFLTKGNRSAALRAAGYKAKPNSLHVLASRIFADDRVRAAVREVAIQMIDVAEPELLANSTLCATLETGRPIAWLRFAWFGTEPTRY